MNADHLATLSAQRLEPHGLVPRPDRLSVYGLHGASDWIIGLRVLDGECYWRRPADPITAAPRESEDDLRIRATPPLGKSIGYFIYATLPAEFCRSAAEKEGAAIHG